ncbi:DUF4058 family protein [Leptothermofonsia sichuanensis E412]|uniref:DUF4058 family protein n=1 Tax=Leptothermofonsia sichuanensis TaxID=2917832 RepID=UPI001CA71F82|nr:DUF4058 family protein [Leptothermofonsia sichuanensis]QZZ19129.1 DUF4058 family protein [Leptothermofonsia sichuanensis E412]
MPSPFPGMNPYLENPVLWREVHKLLIAELARTLNSQLDPRYRVAVEERVYQDSDGSLLVGIPDDMVVRSSPSDQSLPEEKISTTVASTPVTVTLPMPTTAREWYLEVRRVRTREVITVIEILSPANKREGEGQREYLEKRQKILGSATHLVEIDLLRSGARMPLESAYPVSDYQILVSYSNQRPKAALYPFDLHTPIPQFPLPLRSNEDPEVNEPMVDLQTLLHQVYDLNRLDMEVDYRLEPVPPLSQQNSIWAHKLLQEQGLRS